MVTSKNKKTEGPKDDRGFGDLLKKITSVGMGAAFLTEDAIKNVLGDLSLPKDIVNALIQNAKNAKGEVLSSLSSEFREHLAKFDTKEIVDFIAKNYDIEVKTKVSLTPKKESHDDSEDTP